MQEKGGQLKNTRERILEAMFDLVTEKGYDNASLREVGEKLNIKKASIYYYYDAKEDIFVEVVENYFNKLYLSNFERIEKIRSKAEYEDTFLEFAIDLVNDLKANPKEAKFYCELAIQAERIPRLGQMLEEYMSKFTEGVKEYFRFGMVMGALPKDFELEELSFILLCTLEGILKSGFLGQACDTEKIFAVFKNKMLS